MPKLSLLAALGLILSTLPAQAQSVPQRWSFELTSGVLMTGDLATTSFTADFSNFGGTVVQRDGGVLDVVPSAVYGFETGYRITENIHIGASWMHSRGRFRMSFPALASDPGDFNLEGLLLAGFDFQFGQGETQVESGFSQAVTDVYLGSVRVELPTLDGWFFPFLNFGAGLLTQRSTNDVIYTTFEGPIPAQFQLLELQGINPVSLNGLSSFKIRETDPVLQLGMGFRASLSERVGGVRRHHSDRQRPEQHQRRVDHARRRGRSGLQSVPVLRDAV